ncbi:MAG: AMP-binding protein, partial [Microthrixaceae bacterium]|nr:AMP-binding protein [Microthrixaceae bacterium]
RPLLDALDQQRSTGLSPDLSSLRHVISGGAVLSTESKQRILDTIGNVRIIDVLGSTESGRQALASTSANTGPDSGFESSSTAVVLSEDLSRILKPGDSEIGWLAQSGRVPIGYLNDPEKTALTFPTIDGVRYAIPGDRARRSEDGTVELLGRDSVCINTGGEKVFAEEVETALKTHPSVFDAVVCGMPSERYGQEVVAIVEIRPGHAVTDEDLVSNANKLIARYKLPKRIIRVPAVVRSPSGKADYRWATDQAAASLG